MFISNNRAVSLVVKRKFGKILESQNIMKMIVNPDFSWVYKCFDQFWLISNLKR